MMDGFPSVYSHWSRKVCFYKSVCSTWQIPAGGATRKLFSNTPLFLLQSEAAQGLPLLQASCFLFFGLHLRSGPEAVRQHSLPTAPGPEDRLLLPEDWQCLTKGLSAAAPCHLRSCRERGLHAAFSPCVKALNSMLMPTPRITSKPELFIGDVTAALLSSSSSR